MNKKLRLRKCRIASEMPVGKCEAEVGGLRLYTSLQTSWQKSQKQFQSFDFTRKETFVTTIGLIHTSMVSGYVSLTLSFLLRAINSA